jgi:hypothetical protein
MLMSKDTPEVGDVWVDGYNRKILITDVYDLINNGYAECITTDIWRPEILKSRLIPFEEFQFLTYLGKSKANINDLFKTENEE